MRITFQACTAIYHVNFKRNILANCVTQTCEVHVSEAGNYSLIFRNQMRFSSLNLVLEKMLLF